MADATSSYAAAHLRYVAAFQETASPARLRMCLALAQTAWNPPEPDRLRVLDIGCGRGLTACLLAAANPGWEVTGLDLQPVHVAEAGQVAAEAGLDNARFIEADLAELDRASARLLLPEADIVICHGVWTWVPDEVRRGIVALLRARLKPGGLLLIGYNALPGYADCVALQRLLHDAVRGLRGSEAERGAAALAVLERLRAIGSPYLPRPGVLAQIIETARAAPAYMAHEWFTPFWRPVFHADLARDLAAAGLEFAGSARPGTSWPGLHLEEARRAAAAAMPPWMDRETAADLFLHRRFRNDIFIRGRSTDAGSGLGETRLALAVDPARARIALGTQRGMAALHEAQQDALLRALAEGPVRLRDLAALPGAAGLGEAEIALMLVESRTAVPLWRDIPDDPAFAARAARCNAVVSARFGGESFAGPRPLGVVVPALGSAIGVPARDLAVAVALQAGVPADPDILAVELAPSVQDLRAEREAIGATLARHLTPWRGLGVV